MIAVAEERYDMAIAGFRYILVPPTRIASGSLDPLARFFSSPNRLREALANFRVALAAIFRPGEVQYRSIIFAAIILRLKRLSYDVGLAVAQDTNANGAHQRASGRSLRFAVHAVRDARQNSGAGISMMGRRLNGLHFRRQYE